MTIATETIIHDENNENPAVITTSSLSTQTTQENYSPPENEQQSQKDLDRKAALQHMSDVYHFSPPSNVLEGDHAVGERYSHLEGYLNDDPQMLYRAYLRHDSHDDDNLTVNTAPTTCTAESSSQWTADKSSSATSPRSAGRRRMGSTFHNQGQEQEDTSANSHDLTAAAMEHMSSH